MPLGKKVIKDTLTGLFLTSYSTVLANCSWGAADVPLVEFADQSAADAAITSWGETPGSRFIGQNPPLH